MDDLAKLDYETPKAASQKGFWKLPWSAGKIVCVILGGLVSLFVLYVIFIVVMLSLGLVNI